MIVITIPLATVEHHHVKQTRKVMTMTWSPQNVDQKILSQTSCHNFCDANASTQQTHPDLNFDRWLVHTPSQILCGTMSTFHQCKASQIVIKVLYIYIYMITYK